MAFIPKEKRQKFDAKAEEYLFVGYCETQKGYCLMKRDTNDVISCRDVDVFENGNSFLNSDLNNKDFQFIADVNDSNDSTINNIDNDETLENGVRHGQNNVASSNNKISDEDNGVQQNNPDETTTDTSTESFQDADDNDITYVPDEGLNSGDDDTQTVRRSERDVRTPQFYGEPVTHLVIDEKCEHFLNVNEHSSQFFE